MNPFVNPKKRSVTLPKGCKDLVDVLKDSESEDAQVIRRYVNLMLLQAQQDHITKLVISGLPPGKSFFNECIAADTWSITVPGHIRTGVAAELARMAKLPLDGFPREGVIETSFGKVRLRWRIRMTSAGSDCMLTRIPDGPKS